MSSHQPLSKADHQPAKTPQPQVSPSLEEETLVTPELDAASPHMSIARKPSPQNILHLQRLIGNRATVQLMRKPEQAAEHDEADENDDSEQEAPAPDVFPVKPIIMQRKPIGSARAGRIWRKVFVPGPTGGTYRPYPANPRTPQHIQDMVNDDIPRRFNSLTEVQQFADGNLDHMGYVQRDNTWFRLDNRFLVIGEEHTEANNAAPLINAFGTSRYRYEGFSTDLRETAKPPADPRYKNFSQVKEKQALKKKGGDESEVGQHAAEDILPKLARVLPDMAHVATEQIAGRAIDGVEPDLTWQAGYSLARALVPGFYSALLYARSYNFGFFRKHKDKINVSIGIMNTADKNNKMPDFSTLPMTPALIRQMGIVFKKKAKAVLGIKKIKSFIPLLDTQNEARVAHTAESKRADYIRDYSMWQTMQQAKGSDLLFILGDAHRRKLVPLMESQGIPHIYYPDLLKQQKKLNEQAQLSFSDDTYELFKELKEMAGGRLKMNSVRRAGETFRLKVDDKFAPLNLRWKFQSATYESGTVPGITVAKADTSKPVATLVSVSRFGEEVVVHTIRISS